MKFPPIAALAPCLLAVAACSTTPSPAGPTRPPIPPHLLAPCLRPSPLLVGSFPEVAAKLAESSARLSECDAKVAALRKILTTTKEEEK